MKKNTIKSIKGFKDILPDEIKYYRYFELISQKVSKQFSIEELRTPIIEKSELFNRSIGEGTDIVNKEMYDFIDKSGDSICLRPEGTASIVRSVIEHALVYDRGLKKQKYWYHGPMFRHEKPQKGRYRQFSQFGVEYYGFSDSNSELELIMMGNSLLHSLNIEQATLHINSLGNKDDKKNYEKIIFNHLGKYKSSLDEYQKDTLAKNPLRLLDSKNDNIKELLLNVPTLYETLSDASKSRFDILLKKLDDLEIHYLLDNSIVRGLDYYNDTVFEWRHQSLGSQNAICAGGRYDELVNSIGGDDVPAVGFAMGVERIIEILKLTDNLKIEPNIVIPIINTSSEEKSYAHLISKNLRQHFDKINFYNTDSSVSLTSQLKHAMRINDKFIIIITDANIKNNNLTIKSNEDRMSDTIVSWKELIAYMSNKYE
ncbi:MAG: histidine--tRNA ligase [Gammaproteobacteria bacterium]|nr:histidine--tRNA ligase [Gammaproteobacteria bacterium]